MGLLFTEEQIEQVNGINILNYARDIGMNPVKFSANSYKIKGYGGLYIRADGCKWNWFSESKGGGIIQFAMEMQGLSWKDAVSMLLESNFSDYYISKPEKAIEQKGVMKLPKPNYTNKHVIDYLVHGRKIDLDVIAPFLKNGTLYENTYKSCVFVGYDEKKKERYGFIRGTNLIGDPFYMESEHSDKRYNFHRTGNGTTLCVFEAAIDMLSYLTLLRYHHVDSSPYHMLSLSGVSSLALHHYLEQHPEVSMVILCLDNDKAGNLACEKIGEELEEKGIQFKRHSPKRKDFNRDLKEVYKEHMKMEINYIEEKSADEVEMSR